VRRVDESITARDFLIREGCQDAAIQGSIERDMKYRNGEPVAEVCVPEHGEERWQLARIREQVRDRLPCDRRTRLEWSAPPASDTAKGHASGNLARAKT